MSKGTSREGGVPTLGSDAAPLERFSDVEADGNERIIYDVDVENAWIQSDVYYAGEDCV